MQTLFQTFYATQMQRQQTLNLIGRMDNRIKSIKGQHPRRYPQQGKKISAEDSSRGPQET